MVAAAAEAGLRAVAPVGETQKTRKTGTAHAQAHTERLQQQSSAANPDDDGRCSLAVKRRAEAQARILVARREAKSQKACPHTHSHTLTCVANADSDNHCVCVCLAKRSLCCPFDARGAAVLAATTTTAAAASIHPSIHPFA